MDSTVCTEPASHAANEPRHRPRIDALERYLIERGYARNTVRAYLGYGSHFLQWTQRSGLDLRRVDDKVVAEFLDEGDL